MKEDQETIYIVKTASPSMGMGVVVGTWEQVQPAIRAYCDQGGSVVVERSRSNLGTF